MILLLPFYFVKFHWVCREIGVIEVGSICKVFTFRSDSLLSLLLLYKVKVIGGKGSFHLRASCLKHV